MTASIDAGDLVDLERYPILDLESSTARALIARCRADLKSEGAANLYGFIRPAAVDALVCEAEALLPVARVKKSGSRNVYVKPIDDTWPSDHPGRTMLAQGGSAQIAYDRMKPTSSAMVRVPQR